MDGNAMLAAAGAGDKQLTTSLTLLVWGVRGIDQLPVLQIAPALARPHLHNGVPEFAMGSTTMRTKASKIARIVRLLSVTPHASTSRLQPRLRSGAFSSASR